MSIHIARGHSDAGIEQINAVLKGYEHDHPRAVIDIYRQNSVSVRIRIIDPDFRGLERSERHERVWKYLEKLPDEAQADVSMLVPLCPDETEKSFANLEFDDPLPSRF